MKLTGFQWYIIAINIVAFLVFTIDFQIYKNGGEGIKYSVIKALPLPQPHSNFHRKKQPRRLSPH